MILSQHARMRKQQRAVPNLVIDLLLEFGKIDRSQGADRYVLDRKSRVKLASKIGASAYEALRPLLNTYLIISEEGRIVTIAKRQKRFRR
jgi:hypothetical protein